MRSHRGTLWKRGARVGSRPRTAAALEEELEALEVADEKGCEEILAFATSAVRDSVNADAVLDHVHERTDVRIEVLSGEDEARLASQGVLMGWPDADGLVADLGTGERTVGLRADLDALRRDAALLCSAGGFPGAAR